MLLRWRNQLWQSLEEGAGKPSNSKHWFTTSSSECVLPSVFVSSVLTSFPFGLQHVRAVCEWGDAEVRNALYRQRLPHPS